MFSHQAFSRDPQLMRRLGETTSAYLHDFRADGQPEVGTQGPACSTANLAHGTLRFSGHLPGGLVHQPSRGTRCNKALVIITTCPVPLTSATVSRLWRVCARHCTAAGAAIKTTNDPAAGSRTVPFGPRARVHRVQAAGPCVCPHGPEARTSRGRGLCCMLVRTCGNLTCVRGAMACCCQDRHNIAGGVKRIRNLHVVEFAGAVASLLKCFCQQCWLQSQTNSPVWLTSGYAKCLCPRRLDHTIDEPVLKRLLRVEILVAVEVPLNLRA